MGGIHYIDEKIEDLKRYVCQLYNEINVEGGSAVNLPVRQVNSNTTAVNNEVLEITSNNITVTLPSAIGNINKYIIKNSGSGDVTIQGSETIDGDSFILLEGGLFKSYTIKSNSTTFIVI